MNQASDTSLIQSLAFFGKKLLFLEKNLKNDNFLNGIKTKQDKIKNSNIVEKIWFVSEMPLPEKGSCLKKMWIYKSYLSLKILICKKAKQCYDKSNWPSNRFLARNLTLTKDFTQVTCLTAATAAVTLAVHRDAVLCTGKASL